MSKQPLKLAIIGAGIMGLLAARELASLGWDITLYEGLSWDSYQQTTGFAAAGMLAPYSEMESAEPLICELGRAALALWPQVLAPLSEAVFFRQHGSLLLSHPRDRPHYEQLVSRITKHAPPAAYRWVIPAELEAELSPNFDSGLYLPDEAHIDTRQVLRSLLHSLRQAGVKMLFSQEIKSVQPYRLETAQGSARFDLLCDCRGYGAASTQKNLRGVRGEAFILHAPAVNLQRPIRLMHPRYAVYIVPREQQVYYIGATSIETAGKAAVTVRSTLELLSAAFSVHSGFGEATILEAVHGIRPAYPDHLPRIHIEAGLISINGLYRHGFLLAPTLAQQLRQYFEDAAPSHAAQLFTFA